jgi:hypothetical protein
MYNTQPDADGGQNMKTPRIIATLSFILVPATFAAQTAANPHGHTAASPVQATSLPAQSAFKQLQSLAGTWKGATSTVPAVPQMQGDSMSVTMRVTSLGNAIMHNMRSPRRPDDPITMLYLENDRLLLTHYCDSGNRPRMAASVSPDGKTITFQFVDLVGPTTYGHMNHAVFTIIDENHHIEEWTYILPGNKGNVVAHFDLYRTNNPKASADR